MDADILKKAQSWLDGSYDQQTKEQIRLMMKNNEQELINSFYRDLEFGTGGLRGIIGAGTNRMNKYTVGMATQGLVNYLLECFPGEKIKAVIAHDSRHKSREFTINTASIFAANGITAYIFSDLRPTPELSFAVRELGCHTGIVITASHNPPQYNGYKVYWQDGGQVIAPHDKNIIARVQAIKSIDEVKWQGHEENIITLGNDIDDRYREKVKSLSLNSDIIKKHKSLPIVYTSLHGTGITQVPASLSLYGFDNIILVEEQKNPDPDFSTVKSPNPEEHEAMSMAIKKAESTGAELVLATDPDCDRVGLAVRGPDNKMLLLNGNQTATLLIYYMLNQYKEQKKLTGREYIVKTIVTTELLKDIADYYRVECFDVLTGFKYIAGIIKQNEGRKKFLIGGEESYGYLAGEFVRDKDAVIASVLAAEACAWAKNQGVSFFRLLEKIYEQFGLYKEALFSLNREGKQGEEEIAGIMRKFRNSPPEKIGGSRVICIKDFKKSLAQDCLNGSETAINLPKSDVLQFFTENRSKITVRPSGTEPKIKFYISVYAPLLSGEYAGTSALLEDRIKIVKTQFEL